MPKNKIVHMQGIGDVLLERSSRARRLIITVRPLKGVRIAVPRGISFAAAEQLARTRAEWMKIQLCRMEKMTAAYQGALIREAAIDRQEAKKILTARVEHIAVLHGYSFNRITVRNQKTRWGSCSGANNISLNMKLILLPDELRDYIILHELVHTRIKNHGPRFREELQRLEPRAVEFAARIRQCCLQLL